MSDFLNYVARLKVPYDSSSFTSRHISDLLNQRSNIIFLKGWRIDLLSVIELDYEPFDLSDAWLNVIVRFPDLASRLGTSSVTAINVFNLLKSNNLIFPDGTIHGIPNSIINLGINEYVEALKKKQEEIAGQIQREL